MIDNNEIVRRILEVTPDDINLIALFESRARGDHSKSSDFDIAVSITESNGQKRSDLRFRIISALEGLSIAVDVVIIEDADWALSYRIARDGIALFQRNEGSWSDFIEEVLIHYPDYRMFVERQLKETLGGV